MSEPSPPPGIDKIKDSSSSLTVIKGTDTAKALDSMETRVSRLETVVEGFLLERFPIHAKVLVEFYLGLFGFQGKGRSAFAANVAKRVGNGQWMTKAQVVYLEESFCRENEENTSHAAETKNVLASIEAAVDAGRCTETDASALRGILFQFLMIQEGIPKENHEKTLQEINKKPEVGEAWERKARKSKLRIITPRPGVEFGIRL